MSCVCVCVFFFFKQKTAYEMRISDWSSDVCSSDLRNLRLLEQRGLIQQAVSPEDRRRRVIRLTTEGKRTFLKALPLWQKAQAALSEKIGRASCRERVCQSV